MNRPYETTGALPGTRAGPIVTGARRALPNLLVLPHNLGTEEDGS